MSSTASGSDDGLGMFDVRSLFLSLPSSTPCTTSDAVLGRQEPADYRPATPPPTVRSYKRRKYGGIGERVGEDDVEVGLVSGHPLWGAHALLIRL
jgi:hypothetical protein